MPCLEGLEGSYTSDRYAVFFVEFDCKTTQFEGFARILRRILLSRIFSPMDNFSQDFRITWLHQKLCNRTRRSGAEGAYHSTLEKRTECLKRIIRRGAFNVIHFEGDLLAGLIFRPLNGEADYKALMFFPLGNDVLEASKSKPSNQRNHIGPDL